MVKFVKLHHPCGTKKDYDEIIEEMGLLLNIYRRENLRINDLLFNYQHNIFPEKDNVIKLLQQANDKLQTDLKHSKSKWLFG